MRKKNDPEQEQPAADEQEVEQPEEETEQPQEPDTEEQEDAEEAEDSAEEEEEENPQEQPQGDQQAGAPAEEQPATGADDENARLRSDLLQAQGKLAAYAAGVAPGMIDDAVTLAMAEAAKSGEVTEAAVTKAMEAVLKRHPEWKASGTDKPKGGFRLGADRDGAGASRKPTGNANQNVKRWNRFK